MLIVQKSNPEIPYSESHLAITNMIHVQMLHLLKTNKCPSH